MTEPEQKEQMETEQVPAPEELSQRKKNIAVAYVNNELKEGLTVQEFCRKHGLSSATLTKWNKDVVFTKYIQNLKGEAISSDELKAYEVVKQKILERVNSANPTEKDIQLFLDNFDYVVKYQQQKAMEKLGINKAGETTSDMKTIDEKKNRLLKRLKGTDTDE